MQKPTYFTVTEADNRLTTFPIMHEDLFEMDKKAKDSLWNVKEIDFTLDATDYKHKLTANERHFVSHILAFFAASDGIVNLNLVERFSQEVPFLEAKYFYNTQKMMEDVHAHTYSLLLDSIIPVQAEKLKLFNALRTMPIIKELGDYMFKVINSNYPLPERILMFACVEGILFTGCFCAIYWLQSKGLMPGLAHSNELIARDEALHTFFALKLYQKVNPEDKVSAQRIREIFDEATGIAIKFINAAIPVPLREMNASLMSDYILSQADYLLNCIDIEPAYNKKNPFHFMNQINLMNKTNFFERRVSEYSASASHESATKTYQIPDSF